VSLAETIEELIELTEKSLAKDLAAHNAAVIAAAVQDEHIRASTEAMGEKRRLLLRLRRALESDFHARRTPLPPPPLEPPPPPGMRPASRLTPPPRRK
jgi:hypothetical protein